MTAPTADMICGCPVARRLRRWSATRK